MFFQEFASNETQSEKPQKFLSEIRHDLDQRLDFFGLSRQQLEEGSDLLKEEEKAILIKELESFKKALAQLENIILDPQKVQQHRQDLANLPRDHRIHPI